MYLKPFEADMRHLIDTYIEASEPHKISVFDNMGLLEIILSMKACLHLAKTATIPGSSHLSWTPPIKRNRPDDWSGFQARGQVVKKALYDALKDVDDVECIFKIIFHQHKY